MKVNSDFIPGESVASDLQGFKLNKNRGYDTRTNSGFEQVLSAVENKDTAADRPVKVKPAEKTDNKAKENNVKPKDEPIEDGEWENAAKDKPEETEPDKKTENDKPVEETDINKKPKAVKKETEEKIMSEIAQVLNIPVEKLAQLLGELNLTPSDLADPKNVAALLQKVFDAPTVASLLTLPEFPKLFKAVNEVMASFKPILEQLTVAAETGPAIQTVKAFENENVQAVTDEDGELQVTFKSADAEVSEETSVSEEQAADDNTDAETLDVLPQAAQQQNNIANTGTQSQNPLFQQNSDSAKQEASEQIDFAINTSTNAAQNQTSSVKAFETARAASTGTVDANDVMNQVMSRIRTAGDSFSEIRLTLKPENLGDISLRVITQNGIVTAQFVAESQRIKEILEANFNMLRGSLNEQGINFSELSVSVRQNEQERDNQFEQGRQNSRARIQRINGLSDAAEEISEEENNAAETLQSNVNIRV